MAYLEELLPAFRNGAKIKRECWSLIKFVHIKNGKIVDEDGNHIDFSDEAFICNDWEFYQEPIDWDYIIKNKCLCWFGVVGKEKQRIGIVSAIANFIDSRTYYIDKDTGFSACRPVRKDEVTFYEDKRDGNN